jgi:hypothetical protein
VDIEVTADLTVQVAACVVVPAALKGENPSRVAPAVELCEACPCEISRSNDKLTDQRNLWWIAQLPSLEFANTTVQDLATTARSKDLQIATGAHSNQAEV